MKTIIKNIFTITLVSMSFSACIGPGQEIVVGTPLKTFTKLNSAGLPLADQTKSWNTNDATASEANSDRWSCVKENVSGLIWEIKTHDMGLRDYRYDFTWYDTNGTTNGGDYGIGDLGVWVTTNYQNFNVGSNYPGSDNCFDKNRCDTKKYVADVNAVGFCASTSWRMPTKDELKGLVTGSTSGPVPNINKNYFPDTDPYLSKYSYWTSTMLNTISYRVQVVDFGTSSTDDDMKHSEYKIRLVRTP